MAQERISRFDGAAVSRDLHALRDKIKMSMTQWDVDEVKSLVTAIVDRISVLGQDSNDPDWPSNPSSHGHPANPSHTSHPANPSNPSYPANPSHTSHPANPSNPSYPANPANPANPGYPANPAHQSNPENPGYRPPNR